MTELYYEDVAIGDELPSFVRQTDFMNWNRYAAVNDEFVFIHMDDESGRNGGNEKGAFGMGNLRWAYLHNMLRNWIGDNAEVRELSVQFRAINQKHDVLSCIGKVVEKHVDGGEPLVRLSVDVLNQDGKSTTPGYAVVVLPSSADAALGYRQTLHPRDDRNQHRS